MTTTPSAQQKNPLDEDVAEPALEKHGRQGCGADFLQRFQGGMAHVKLVV
jgi:hypothetical protein